MPRWKWGDLEVSYVAANSDVLSDAEMAETLSFVASRRITEAAVRSIRNQIARRGIYIATDQLLLWGDPERDFIKQNWQTMSDEAMAESLSLQVGRKVSKASVGQFRRRLGIGKKSGRPPTNS